MKKINWGIIGLGNIAQSFSEGFLYAENSRLLAVSSKNKSKLELFKNITVLTVTHNSENVIKKFLRTLDINLKLFVVDNESKDKTRSILKKYPHKSKKLVFNKKGLGFGSAANIGFKKIKTKYILLMNPDSQINLTSISKLYQKAKIYTNAAILAPLHRNHKGMVHIPTRPFFFNKQNDLLNMQNFYGDCSVEYLSGAVMLLDRKKIEKIGFFDENFFLYYEDIDLVKRLLNNNNNIYKIPVKYHSEGASHNKRYNYPLELNRNWHYMWSKFYYIKKHKGYFFSLILTLPFFLRSIFKMIYNFNNPEKRNIYYARFSGLLNSYRLKKSWYRPNLKIK